MDTLNNTTLSEIRDIVKSIKSGVDNCPHYNYVEEQFLTLKKELAHINDKIDRIQNAISNLE